jgi:23S rRNA (cytosine1962-C5)-methyltransferase
MLLSCSCSRHVDLDLFRKIIFSAALDAGREVVILGCRTQPADHPVSVYLPEQEYLKAVLLRIL